MAQRRQREEILWNEDQIAREKLLYRGTSELSDAELLSLILGGSTAAHSSVAKASRLLEAYHNSPSSMVEEPVASLKVKGALSDSEAIRVKASVEFARRLKLSGASAVEVIRSNSDVFALFNPIMGALRHEEFWAVYLSGTNRILEYGQISRGGVNSSMVDVKMVMNKAVTLLASSIIVVHNHPSGSLEVSMDDQEITQKLLSACRVLDINLLDHVIITQNRGVSLREKGLL